MPDFGKITSFSAPKLDVGSTIKQVGSAVKSSVTNAAINKAKSAVPSISAPKIALPKLNNPLAGGGLGVGVPGSLQGIGSSLGASNPLNVLGGNPTLKLPQIPAIPAGGLSGILKGAGPKFAGSVLSKYTSVIKGGGVLGSITAAVSSAKSTVDTAKSLNPASVVDNLKSQVGGLTNNLPGAGLVADIKNKATAVQSTVSGVQNAAQGAVASVSDAVSSTVSNAVDGVSDKVSDATDVTSNVTSKFDSLTG